MMYLKYSTYEKDSKTEDGRKGAIKIKDFVANGTSSYILVDIKVQKLP